MTVVYAYYFGWVKFFLLSLRSLSAAEIRQKPLELDSNPQSQAPRGFAVNSSGEWFSLPPSSLPQFSSFFFCSHLVNSTSTLVIFLLRWGHFHPVGKVETHDVRGSLLMGWGWHSLALNGQELPKRPPRGTPQLLKGKTFGVNNVRILVFITKEQPACSGCMGVFNNARFGQSKPQLANWDLKVISVTLAERSFKTMFDTEGTAWNHRERRNITTLSYLNAENKATSFTLNKKLLQHCLV